MAQAGHLAGEDYRRETERLIKEHAGDGAVILGRAGAVILRDYPDALHVRLDGPADRRVARAMAHESLSADDAERLRKSGDRAREAYVRHFYNCDARNSKLYHLVIDSTALSDDTVVEVIVAATR
jgi:cytidylate kinase